MDKAKKESLMDKAKMAVRTPFRLEECHKISESQFNGVSRIFLSCAMRADLLMGTDACQSILTISATCRSQIRSSAPSKQS